jgi:UDP-glucose 4-epimerase
MKVLITGGLGFVGINLVRDLAQQPGVEVIAADLLALDAQIEQFLQPVKDKVHIKRLDVRDKEAFRQIVFDNEITHIVHAAAVTPDLERERSQAPLVVDINLVGALHALNITYETPRIQKLLLVSSSGVYGVPPVGGAAVQYEEGPLQLDHLYAITKYSAELLAARYAALCGKQFAAVRLGSVFGPMERPTGSRQHMSHIRRLCDALQSGRVVKAAGPDVRRDWVYTQDVSSAVGGLLAAPSWNFPVYNVGGGEAVVFRDLLSLFTVRGLKVEWVQNLEEADISMAPSQERPVMDLSRLKKDTGFVPGFGGLQGIQRALNTFA